MARAKREALEMAGTCVQALTVVKDFRVERDEVLALSAGVVKAEIVSQKNYATGDAFMAGSRARGCSDVQRACQLGQCGAYEWARQEGYCR